MSQATLFDADKSEIAKERGMSRAAASRSALLAVAQDLAVKHATANPERTCTADDVQKALISAGYDPGVLGNAAGSIFKTGQWEHVEFVKSERVSNHGRMIRIWKLRS